MIAILPVRGGILPVGSSDATQGSDAVFVVGMGCQAAVESLTVSADDVFVAEVATFSPWALADALIPHINDHDCVVVPASPDGRDLAPHLAAALHRPLLSGVVEIASDPAGRIAVVSRHDGQVMEHHRVPPKCVMTVQPGLRHTVERNDDASHATSVALRLATGRDLPPGRELPADPTSMDLAEASRIVGGGAGLGSAESFDELANLGAMIGASLGGTRVVMDWGWIPFNRQIGTTGVAVDPDLYLAFGISGAVQHTAGLGSPQHIISVNNDPYCPMMSMADLAIVSDAPAVLVALGQLLED